MNMMHDDILTGYWKSDKDFLDKNNISVFTMAMSPSKNSTRNIYIVMKDNNNKIIINELNTITLTKNLSSMLSSFYSSSKIKYYVNFEHSISNKSGEIIIPQELNMIYEPISGFLTMYNNNIVYVQMYKDNELSDIEIDEINDKQNNSTKSNDDEIIVQNL